jgi:hypothetical protein
LPGKDQELGRTVAYQLFSFVFILFHDESSDIKFRAGHALTARIRDTLLIILCPNNPNAKPSFVANKERFIIRPALIRPPGSFPAPPLPASRWFPT